MKLDKTLLENLIELRDSNSYPFHMPGHKRHMEDTPLKDAYTLDITEIEGFDNLHDPKGILLKEMEYARELYGTKKTFFLINGSTVGILAAIFSCCKGGDTILMARNSHKSAYHGVALRNLQVDYLYPTVDETWGIAKGIAVEQVKEKLDKNPKIKAVFLTSPTYDGYVSSIKGIAAICHEKNIPLIVDEAHGAHFLFHERFPKSALEQGADLVIQSIHKTLPAFTQTALLHLQGNLVKLNDIEKFLKMFQSSSPSYVLMAGITECMHMLGEKKDILFSKQISALDQFYDAVKALQCLQMITGEEGEKDYSKILVSVKKAGINGRELSRILREEYALEMEMEAETYVLAISSCMDSLEGLERFQKALLEIDQKLRATTISKSIDVTDSIREEMLLSQKESIGEALEKDWEYTELDLAEGKESADFLNLYPPGIPFIVPGEVFQKELILKIHFLTEQGFLVQGLEQNKVKIVREK